MSKKNTVRQIHDLAGAWHQPCITGEPDEERFQRALGMIREIADWALHPARGDEPPHRKN